MSISTKKKALTEEQKNECAELKKIFEQKKAELNLSQAEVAEYFGMSQSAINHYLNGINALNAYIATKFAKLLRVTVSTFSERLALEIADMAKSIDQDQINLLMAEQNSKDERVVIDVLNVEASAGNGTVGDLVEVVSRLYYVPEQYYTLFRGINPDGIRVINIKGDSMSPTFNSGDMVFVNIKIQSFDGDGVYIFNYKNALYIKRLQRIGEKFLVLSDNKTYKEWDIDDENQLFIQGKVIVHQSQKLNFIG